MKLPAFDNNHNHLKIIESDDLEHSSIDISNWGGHIYMNNFNVH